MASVVRSGNYWQVRDEDNNVLIASDLKIGEAERLCAKLNYENLMRPIMGNNPCT